jgi:hypothetical protein
MPTVYVTLADSRAVQGRLAKIAAMPESVAVIARTKRLARSAAPCVRAKLGKTELRLCSLRGFLASSNVPRRVVLCAGRESLADGIAFLRRARERLLWPAPAAELEEAVGGIRSQPSPGSQPAKPRRRAARAGRVAAALLLEGSVGPERVGAALAAAGPRHWIVEAAGRVRLPDRTLEELARAGIRWSALEPVELVALCASPALARARRRWRRLLPPATPVWVRTSGRRASASGRGSAR